MNCEEPGQLLLPRTEWFISPTVVVDCIIVRVRVMIVSHSLYFTSTVVHWFTGSPWTTDNELYFLNMFVWSVGCRHLQSRKHPCSQNTHAKDIS